ncbi:hypothetical protein ACFYZB_04210 [Streptomyces sp. NPDC001852]|uniref:hypothetical protein n=1 Tax=Streptomyces sp. NPDC001852 TaxID=3364619 RepID=UPI0036C78DCE
MRRTVSAVVLLACLPLTACATRTAAGAVPAVTVTRTASSSVSPSPSVTFLPDDVMQSLSTLSADMKKIVHDGDNSTAESEDCGKLGADASSANVQTLPNPAWQQQWRKTMSELQKGANECSTGQSTGDIPTLQQGLTDVTAANEDLQTFLKMTG